MSIWLGVLVAMILLIAGYGLRRASRPFDPPTRRAAWRDVGQFVDGLGPIGPQRLAGPPPAELTGDDLQLIDNFADAIFRALICAWCNIGKGDCVCIIDCPHVDDCRVGWTTTIGTIPPCTGREK